MEKDKKLCKKQPFVSAKPTVSDERIVDHEQFDPENVQLSKNPDNSYVDVLYKHPDGWATGLVLSTPWVKSPFRGKDENK